MPALQRKFCTSTELHDFAGMIPGILVQLIFAGGAIWTLYLLITLYFEFKKRMVSFA